MPNLSTISEYDGQYSMTFGCGELPADAGVVAAGHEPNGYFWEGLASYVAPELVERVELDSEGGAFFAEGSLEDLEQLQARLEPLLVSPDTVRELVGRAEADGVEFDD